MSAKKVFIIVGTRPNFIKVTQFKRVAKQYPGIEFVILHTGQHFDEKMAANGIVFFCFLLQRIKITEFPSVLRHLLFEEQFRIWGAYGLHYRFNIMIFVIE